MRAAIVSTFPPRACGIGTFAADLRSALAGVDEIDSVGKVVVVDDPSRPQRPGVIATISQATRGDYVRAARILGRRDVDVVLLEHEYGIFGGKDGEYVLSLAEQLTQPLVVDAAHRSFGADAAPGARPRCTVRSRGARDRDDRHGVAFAC